MKEPNVEAVLSSVTPEEAMEIYADLFARGKKLPKLEFVFAPTGEMLLYTVEKSVLRLSQPRLRVWVVNYSWGELGIFTRDEGLLKILREMKGVFPKFSLPSIRYIMESGVKSFWGTYTLEVKGSKPVMEVSDKGVLTIIKNGTYVLRDGVTSFKPEE
jgi:hypothetical protein